MHPVVARILEERRIDDIEKFLHPAYHDRPDPFLMRDMEKAVGRIVRAITQKETIAAWTDYDCDGIPAGALLSDFFKMIQYPLRSYIPERSEGYGLNINGIQKLKEEGVSLIITADCGITDIDAVAHARALGIEVIVTDHHLPQERLPDAVAVLNPHRVECEYPFKELCGTGVAFKLVEALISKNRECGEAYFSWREGQEKWLLDLVALATIADMVPLVGENRTLVRFGLLVVRKGRRRGLRALFEKARVPLRFINEDDIAFSVAPKINAASRMASPLLSLQLLISEEENEAREVAEKLVSLNDARRLSGANIAKEIKRRLALASPPEVIVIGNPEWNPALLGIAATGVVETYQRPVCLWGREGDMIKGSCRSDGTVNIVSLMSYTEELFNDFGGHERSGGFSTDHEKVHALPEKLRDAYRALKRSDDARPADDPSDGQLCLSEVDESLVRGLFDIAPFGVCHPKPRFTFRGVSLVSVSYFGKNKEHARLVLCDETAERQGIIFFATRSPLSSLLVPSDSSLTIEGTIEKSFFASREEIRIRVTHIVPED